MKSILVTLAILLCLGLANAEATATEEGGCREGVKMSGAWSSIYEWVGWSVAVEGDVVVAGAPGYLPLASQVGCAYVFDLHSGETLHRLFPAEWDPIDDIGRSVALCSGIAYVGAPRDDDVAENAGCVYIFDVVTGEELGKLLPEDGTEQMGYGSTLAVSDDILAVGAPTTSPHQETGGSVYVYRRSTLELLYKLELDNDANRFFGQSLAILESSVVVGAAGPEDEAWGTACVFDLNTGEKTLEVVSSGGDGAYRSQGAVALTPDHVLVGVVNDGGYGLVVGSVDVFDRSTGAKLTRLTPTDVEGYDDFGASMAVFGDIVAIGAPEDPVHGDDHGSVYLFELGTWRQVAKLKSEYSQETYELGRKTRFGWSIAMTDGHLAVGAYADTWHREDGSVTVFDITQFPLEGDVAGITDDGPVAGADGDVGMPGVLWILAQWGCPVPEDGCQGADVAMPDGRGGEAPVGDGQVDTSDLFHVLGNWGPC